MRVLLQFRMVFGAARRHFQRVEQAVGLGGAQVWALSVIQQSPDLSLGALAQALRIRQPTASNMVKQLVARGLVQAERSAGDRRRLLLRATPDGLALLARVPGPPEGVLPQALSRLEPDVLHHLETHLQTLLGHLQVDEATAHTPLSAM
jgi:DNA-binding MarR family transcriptional regulator